MFRNKTKKALNTLNEKINITTRNMYDIEDEINKKIEENQKKENKQILIIKNYLLKKNIEFKKQIDNDENKITNLTKQMEKLVNENKEIKETIEQIINALNAVIKKQNIGE